MLRIVRASLAAIGCAVIPGTLFAGAYPERPIRLIVPFAPGGGSDINARILAEPVSASLGQTLVIDNRPGAGSSLGSALARTQPGKFTFGSAGVGTGSHLATTLLTLKTTTHMLHVPFKGTGPALTALLTGEITMYMSTFASALPHVKGGRLRAYGVTTLKRAEPLPDVPTIAEEGVADFEYAAWYGLFAPTGTARSIIGKVHAAAMSALKSPQVLQLYKAQGLHATPTTSEDFRKYFAAEKAKWAAVVREAKIAQQ